MAFLKYANAALVKPAISMPAWDEVRDKALATGSAFESRNAATMVQAYDPGKYMLSHCTIIASVDTERGPGKLGRHIENGFQVDRRYADYYITPETSKFVNSNNDSWERKLLLATFRTFIGSENYCFVPGTAVVMADGTQKAIEDVRVGDEVLTHEGRARRVVKTFERHVDEDICSLYFDQLKTPVKCTKEHPFLAASTPETWSEAGSLKVHDYVLGPRENRRIGRRAHKVSWTGVEHYSGPVYNFEVEEDNSYVLGLAGIAVHNCEHLQIPELSKGKIIDACARDIGESVYVDILVATELKHKPLVHAIRTRQLNTLSMGCTVAFTQCSKCGNVAEDETQLCAHIKYAKGNNFIDEMGKTRKIAELCGHIKAEPGSVKFIEASWVANPAFTGAVVRNILTPEQAAIAGVPQRLQLAFSQPAKPVDPNLMQRAARLQAKRAQGEDFDLGDDFGGQSQSEPQNSEENPLDKAVKDLAEYMREKAVKQVRKDMSQEETVPSNLDENRNETLIKEAASNLAWRRLGKFVAAKVGSSKVASKLLFGLLLFKSGGWNAVRASERFSGREFLAMSRLIDTFEGARIAGETRIYRTIVAVGGMSPYADVESYLAACRRVVGRELTGSEKDALISKGRLYDLGVS